MKQIIILGVGNILWADEGFGVRAVEALHERYEFPENVRLIDGGTQGLTLLPIIEDADVLVILDAVDYGLEPGRLHLVDDDAVPYCLSAKKMSLHQTSMLDVLGLARLNGRLPARMRLIGVQPLNLENYGASVTPSVRAQIDPAVAETVAFLAGQGVVVKPRPPGQQVEPLGPLSVGLAAYEAGCFA
ncbi:MAG TPA: HyaD/HybD family hydrogenase maturation endopeptidase [Acidocella sp.]|nr:HyaD/HybD family hydrogenase maturation endopeptidase [Acidocella sp.]OYV24887.1 MAG: hydrogenase expression/formation protein [Rhodospirillales bacterium 20-58-10]HQT37932.1 HyaD/HybD family hydrogenase maturation endopeptidase [Acidocella sp.]